MVKSLWRGTLVVPLLLSFLFAFGSTTDYSDYEDILELERQTNDGLALLTLSEFEKYFLAPREYSAVVLFTVSDSHAECKPCIVPRAAVTNAAKQIRSGVVTAPSKVVFFKSFVDEVKILPQYLRMSDVPHIYVLKNDSMTFYNDKNIVKDPKSFNEFSRIVIKEAHRFKPDVYVSDFGLQTFLEHKLKLSKGMLSKKSFSFTQRTLFAVGFVTFVCIGLFVINSFRNFILAFPIWRAILAVLSVSVSCGGIVYSVQHGSAMVGPVDPKTGVPELVSTRGRHQYGGEGILFGCGGVICMLLIHLGMSMALKSSSKSPANKQTAKKKSGTTNRESAYVTGAIALMVAGFLVYSLVMSAYNVKNTFGTSGFFPPDGFVTGSWRNDRGYSYM